MEAFESELEAIAYSIDLKQRKNMSGPIAIHAGRCRIILGSSPIDPTEFGTRFVVPEALWRLRSKIRFFLRLLSIIYLTVCDNTRNTFCYQHLPGRMSAPNVRSQRPVGRFRRPDPFLLPTHRERSIQHDFGGLLASRWHFKPHIPWGVVGNMSVANHRISYS